MGLDTLGNCMGGREVLLHGPRLGLGHHPFHHRIQVAADALDVGTDKVLVSNAESAAKAKGDSRTLV